MRASSECCRCCPPLCPVTPAPLPVSCAVPVPTPAAIAASLSCSCPGAHGLEGSGIPAAIRLVHGFPLIFRMHARTISPHLPLRSAGSLACSPFSPIAPSPCSSSSSVQPLCFLCICLLHLSLYSTPVLFADPLSSPPSVVLSLCLCVSPPSAPSARCVIPSVPSSLALPSLSLARRPPAVASHSIPHRASLSRSSSPAASRSSSSSRACNTPTTNQPVAGVAQTFVSHSSLLCITSEMRSTHTKSERWSATSTCVQLKPARASDRIEARKIELECRDWKTLTVVVV